MNQPELFQRCEGQGPTLILLSANPGDSRDFDAVAPQLARRFRLIRLDWPGYGGSAPPQPPSSAGAGCFLDCFSRYMDTLDPGPVHLLGNSVGGNVAVRYALRQPQRVASLVLVSPGGFTAHNAISRAFCRLQGQLWFKRLWGVDGFARFYLHARNEWTRAMLERAAGGQSGLAALEVNAAVWRSFVEPDHDLRRSAAALRLPALVVSGRHDPVIPARDGRAAASVIPGARQVVLDSGHAPFAEVPEAFLAAVGEFWDSLERAHAA